MCIRDSVAASLEMAIGRAMAPLTQSLDTFIKCATREQVDGYLLYTSRCV